MKKKHSIALLISAIIGIAYAIYIISYFTGAISSSLDSDAELIGSSIATALATPHMILVVLAVIFNWIAFFTNIRGLALTGAICYTVAGVIFLVYFLFVLPSLIFSFVGFATLGKINKKNKEINTEANAEVNNDVTE